MEVVSKWLIDFTGEVRILAVSILPAGPQEKGLPMRSRRFRVVSTSVLASGYILLASAAAGIPPATLKIPDSTPVKLLLLDRLNSSINQIDDIIHFEVAEDVKVRGEVIIPKGALAAGHMVEARSSGGKRRKGTVELSLDYVKAVNGSNIRIHAAPPPTARQKNSLMSSPLRRRGKSKDAPISPGSRYVAYVVGNHEVSLENVESGSSASGAQALRSPNASSMNELSFVSFTSNPDHADITVDGKFLGTTPSSLRLASGDYSVTIEKTGFKAWQRILTVGIGGDVSLDVTLEKAP